MSAHRGFVLTIVQAAQLNEVATHFVDLLDAHYWRPIESEGNGIACAN